MKFPGEGFGNFPRVAADFMNWWAVGCGDSLFVVTARVVAGCRNPNFKCASVPSIGCDT
jgi:hypothetical protein